MNDFPRQASSDSEGGALAPAAQGRRGALYADKAAQLKALAEHAKQPEARHQLLVLSLGYEALAARILNSRSH